jgi:hypothetical protein
MRQKSEDHMRKIIVLFGVLILAFAFWIGTRLSADAIGLAVGVVFGVLASIPASLLVIAAGRRGDRDNSRDEYNPRQLADSPYQPPVIIWREPAQLPAPQQQNYVAPAYQPAPTRTAPARRPAPFRVVGENEAWVDADNEWISGRGR